MRTYSHGMSEKTLPDDLICIEFNTDHGHPLVSPTVMLRNAIDSLRKVFKDQIEIRTTHLSRSLRKKQCLRDTTF